MRGSIKDLPVAFEDQGVTSRQAEWGDMNIAIETMPAGMDTAPIFKGLPDDRCQCPHWGFAVSGRFTVQYKDHQEVIRAGDAYYLAPGHTCRFDEDTEVIEFSPRDAYQETMEVAARNVAAMQGA